MFRVPYSKVLFDICELLHKSVHPQNIERYILPMIFYKAISDKYKAKYTKLKNEKNYPTATIEDILRSELFVLPKGSLFEDIYSLRHKTGNGQRIDSALQAIETSNQLKLENIFYNTSFNTEELGSEQLRDKLLVELLEYINGLDSLIKENSQFKNYGQLFDYTLNFLSMHSKSSAKPIYTPPELSTLFAALLKPNENDDICDPFCGSGSLLLKLGSIHPMGREKYATHCKLYGQEVDHNALTIARMNMILNDEDQYLIEWGDTLRNPKLLDKDNNLLKFDVVASFPPFSVKNWGYEELANDSFNRFHRGMPPKYSGDYAFISHMIETLKPNSGRMAVVVPHGVLFRSGSEQRIRQTLIEDNLLDAVIGLPANLLYSTGIPIVILIFKQNREDKKVLFIDASNDYERSRHRNNTLSKEAVKKIITTFENRDTIEQYSSLATFDEIQNNDFNLNIPRYVDTSDPIEKIDIYKVLAEHSELSDKLARLNTTIKNHLKALNFDK